VLTHALADLVNAVREDKQVRVVELAAFDDELLAAAELSRRGRGCARGGAARLFGSCSSRWMMYCVSGTSLSST
jgi:hypothetical protein